MEKYAKKLQDIINEQDFCFEPEEIKTVEKALGVLRMYEDANIPAEACAEYRKFEDELIRDGMSLQHVLDLKCRRIVILCQLCAILDHRHRKRQQRLLFQLRYRLDRNTVSHRILSIISRNGDHFIFPDHPHRL